MYDDNISLFDSSFQEMIESIYGKDKEIAEIVYEAIGFNFVYI